MMEATQYDWRTNLILTISVIVTVLAALLLAQLDESQNQLPDTPTVAVVARVTATPSQTSQPFTPDVTISATSPSLLTRTATPLPIRTGTATPIPMLPHCLHTPAHWLPHQVRADDSLTSLAVSTGATVAELTQANCLETNQLEMGMTIYLPPEPPPRPTCGPSLWWVRYTVQRGDTMFSLSIRTGTTVANIMRANCLSSSYLVAGRQIYLPALPPMPTKRPPVTATYVPSPTQISLPPTETATAVPPTKTPTVSPPTTSPTHTPTTTATPSLATVTPTTTATLTPTVTVTAVSPTPTPTAVTPTSTPTTTNTPVPSLTPTPTLTPTITETPVPSITATSTPVPTLMLTPTETVAP